MHSKFRLATILAIALAAVVVAGSMVATLPRRRDIIRLCSSRDVEKLNDAVESGWFLDAVVVGSDKSYLSGWRFPIHLAAEACNPAAIRVFLDARVDPDTRDSEGHTPVYWLLEGLESTARTEAAKECLQLLVSMGSDIDHPVSYEDAGRTAMHFAAFYMLPNAVVSLANADGDVNAVDTAGNTPLHVVAAIRTGAEAQSEWRLTIAALLTRGADPSLRNKNDKSPLDVAIETNNFQQQPEELRSIFSGKLQSQEGQ